MNDLLLYSIAMLFPCTLIVLLLYYNIAIAMLYLVLLLYLHQLITHSSLSSDLLEQLLLDSELISLLFYLMLIYY